MAIHEFALNDKQLAVLSEFGRGIQELEQRRNLYLAGLLDSDPRLDQRLNVQIDGHGQRLLVTLPDPSPTPLSLVPPSSDVSPGPDGAVLLSAHDEPDTFSHAPSA